MGETAWFNRIDNYGNLWFHDQVLLNSIERRNTNQESVRTDGSI